MAAHKWLRSGCATLVQKNIQWLQEISSVRLNSSKDQRTGCELKSTLTNCAAISKQAPKLLASNAALKSEHCLPVGLELSCVV